MALNLKSEYEWYLANKAELLKAHRGKVLVIKNGTILGIYDSEANAVRETATNHELGTFLVQKCQEVEDRQVFHSRVVFA